MKTIKFNPSDIEVKTAHVLAEFGPQIAEKLKMKLDSVKIQDKSDNTTVSLRLLDEDNDPHDIVLMIIQKPDPLQ